jgi:hypothetical protein
MDRRQDIQGLHRTSPGLRHPHDVEGRFGAPPDHHDSADDHNHPHHDHDDKRADDDEQHHVGVSLLSDHDDEYL